MIITLNNGEEIGLLVCTLVKDGEEEREYLPSSKFLASLCSAYSLSVSEGTSKHVLVCEWKQGKESVHALDKFTEIYLIVSLVKDLVWLTQQGEEQDGQLTSSFYWLFLTALK